MLPRSFMYGARSCCDANSVAFGDLNYPCSRDKIKPHTFYFFFRKFCKRMLFSSTYALRVFPRRVALSPSSSFWKPFTPMLGSFLGVLHAKFRYESSFAYTIFHVFFLCPLKEMVPITARRIVARMENVNIGIFQWSIVYDIRYSLSQKCFSPYAEQAVVFLASIGDPRPTFVRIANGNLRPKSLKVFSRKLGDDKPSLSHVATSLLGSLWLERLGATTPNRLTIVH